MIDEKSRVTNEDLRKWHDAPEHIYFIYSAGRVKIGYSSNWAFRTEEVCNGCPHPASLILVMPGDRKMERGYHALFTDYREQGEWFSLHGDLRRFLDMFASAEGKETLDLAHKDYLEHGTVQ